MFLVRNLLQLCCIKLKREVLRVKSLLDQTRAASSTLQSEIIYGLISPVLEGVGKFQGRILHSDFQI